MSRLDQGERDFYDISSGRAVTSSRSNGKTIGQTENATTAVILGLGTSNFQRSQKEALSNVHQSWICPKSNRISSRAVGSTRLVALVPRAVGSNGKGRRRQSFWSRKLEFKATVRERPFLVRRCVPNNLPFATRAPLLLPKKKNF